MQNVIPIVLLILVLVFVMVNMNQRQTKVLAYIKRKTEEQGATNVIVKAMGRNDDDSSVFSVTFTDEFGIERWAKCQIKHDDLFGAIYWAKSPENTPLSDEKKDRVIAMLTRENQELKAHSVSKSSSTSSKEQIIDALSDEVARLRAELEKAQRVENNDG